MNTKILVIGVIKKEDGVLMRKKPDGSKPYKETWYLFGSEMNESESPEETFILWAKDNLGIDIKLVKHLGWDTEVKEDYDGAVKRFIYLDIEFGYVSGEPKVFKGAEKVEWVPINKLKDYDIVPPSVILFEKLGYL